jgi:SAM-dependent methyltransferase
MHRAGEANPRYFHEAYRTGKHGWEKQEPSPYALAFLRRVRKQGGEPRLLDVGCGEGRHCFAAQRLGFRVTGIDYEPLALRRARARARALHVSGIRFQLADVFALPFPPYFFDVILDYGCLHHQKMSGWAAYQESVLRVLKPSGYYVLSVFSPKFNLFHGASRPWHIAFGAYRRYFTREQIAVLFGQHFNVLEIKEECGGGRGFLHVMMQRRSTPARAGMSESLLTGTPHRNRRVRLELK